MTKKFDPTKPVQTTGGLPARIICTDMRNALGCPLVVLLNRGSYDELVYRREDGGGSHNGRHNLVNVPEVRHEYQNIWKKRCNTSRHQTLEAALAAGPLGNNQRMGVVEYTFEDDELKDVRLVDLNEI